MSRIHFVALAVAPLALASIPSFVDGAQAKHPPKLENLMRSQLERVPNTEVIVSRVTLAPNASLPQHWHPGEEFAYLLDGSVTLHQQGKQNITLRQGEVVRVPLKQIHSAQSGKDGAVIVVFRVHELGKPERVLVK